MKAGESRRVTFTKTNRNWTPIPGQFCMPIDIFLQLPESVLVTDSSADVFLLDLANPFML